MMKKLLYIVAITILFASCENESNTKEANTIKVFPKQEKPVKKTNVYGQEVAFENAADARRLPMLMEGVDSKDIKVIGKVESVCQSSGCWIDVDLGDNNIMHVTFKDEAFTLPKDIAGKIVLMDGTVTTELLSVDLLKKMAKDEGKSQAEINNITEPLLEYSYEATGVVIK